MCSANAPLGTEVAFLLCKVHGGGRSRPADPGGGAPGSDLCLHSKIPSIDRFQFWLEALEARHLAELTFSELGRALRALSSTYVERRAHIVRGAALSGAGKRAAFALFYGPLHYLLIWEIGRRLHGAGTASDGATTVIDLGCGTGVAGAAWVSARGSRARVIGIDRHPWALREAARTYREFGIRAHVRKDDLTTSVLPPGPASFLAAFTVNELPDGPRDSLLAKLVKRARAGASVLIVEPLAGFVAPWWGHWRKTFEEAGGRADEWRVRVDLPPILEKLDRAAGLDHRELTGRSLWLG